MPHEPADFSILARWILPAASDAPLLEDHALVVRDGRILAIVPRARATQDYAPALTLDRPGHVILPGLVDTAVGCGDWSAAHEKAGTGGDWASAQRTIG